MNPFADVIERKKLASNIRQSKLDREREVKEFMQGVAKSFEKDLLEIFPKDKIKFFTFSIIRIDNYEITLGQDYSDSDYISIGHHSIEYGKVKIPFSFDMNESKLTGLMKEALRVLVTKAYRP
ncbi:MAG: hypothetical protein K0R18_339 [Bacillales bacterium]|jgi:hypothetical protein|nr:hypothetical protein [Bacillales bacterium]